MVRCVLLVCSFLVLIVACLWLIVRCLLFDDSGLAFDVSCLLFVGCCVSFVSVSCLRSVLCSVFDVVGDCCSLCVVCWLLVCC